jgi:hypothetical protein
VKYLPQGGVQVTLKKMLQRRDVSNRILLYWIGRKSDPKRRSKKSNPKRRHDFVTVFLESAKSIIKLETTRLQGVSIAVD